MRSFNLFSLIVAVVTLSAAVSAQSRPPVIYGTPIGNADLAALDIDIRTDDGLGLPAGQGTVAEGSKIFAEQCASCHGENAKGGPMFPTMVGGIGSFTTEKRILTPGSIYPYAPILFDYTRRAMPMNAPQSLTNDQVYAVSAYILHLNGLWAADAVLDAASMVKIQMPNRNGFVNDNRPDVTATRCMADCNLIGP